MTGPDDHHTSARTRRAGQVRLHRLGLALAGVVSVTALAACGSSSTPPATTSSVASVPAGGTSSTPASSSTAASSAPVAQPAMIMINKFAYTVPESVSPGAMVMVMNMDSEAHTVTADSGDAFDDKATASATTQFQAPTKPGSYPFHCTYHSNMHGVLVVK